MNINSTVPSSSEVSGDMMPRCGWVMINDVFYCDFAQELFSLMIAMAWKSSFSRNYDSKVDFSKNSVVLYLYPCMFSQHKTRKDILMGSGDKF